MSAYSSNKMGAHAIVLGASMAGLLAARVLSDHFECVTLIERDRLPDGPDNRKGVPQGRHTHGLLAKGQSILSQLFPDLVPALIESGAVTGELAADAKWYHFGGYKIRFHSGLFGVTMSRAFLEYHVRQRVLALKNIRLIQDCDVKGLIATDLNARIVGVKFQQRAAGSIEEALTADLVVDATGRGSASPKWLESLGYPRPEETAIKIDVGYTSRIYRRAPGDVKGAQFLLTYPTPPREKRMGVMFPIEGDRWSMLLGGWHGDHAPTDEQGFLTFARSLPTPDIYNVIKRAEPLSDVFVHKFPSNLRRRYEKMARVPEGYIVLGDALCSVNPVYGQGMTISALDAITLDQSLKDQRQQRGDLRGLSRRFFKDVSKVIDMPWMLTAGEDFRYPETTGPKAPGTDLINAYVAKVHAAVQRDPVVYYAFIEVMNLIQPPTLMFNPKIAWRVLRAARTVRREAALPIQRALEGAQ